MPAVTVLPLGNSGVTATATYSDIAAGASKVSEEALDKRASNPVSKTNSPDYPSSMASTGATSGQEGSSKSPDKKNEDSTLKKTTDTSRQDAEKNKSANSGIGKDGNSTTGTASPSQSSSSYHQNIPSHGTPQQSGYYVAYGNSQMTPESPSPHTGGSSAVYDVGSFFQQPTGFHSSPFTGMATHHYGTTTGQAQPPNSPNSQSVGIPPASPLFPRVTNPTTAALLSVSRDMSGTGNPALSPGPPYVSSSGTTEDYSGWSDNRTIHSPYPPSPQISAQGIPIPYVPGMPLARAVSDRSASFDDSMLPSSFDNSSVGAGQTGGAGGAVPGTLFAHQQQWGYGAPPPDLYGASSPLQPRPTIPYPGQLGAPPHHPHSRHAPHMSPYGGQYFPATSPGPPIQTTASNKGPDGANLFIFHIPNHFTNLDMYQLFCPYGNLLSVRIMVEKDSGRSRGFGFVSYDSPDAAALAIKELNGFAVGNKRLKVQHKQIRPSEQQYDRSPGHGGSFDGGAGGFQNSNYSGGAYGSRSMNLPPSGPSSLSAGWCNRPSPEGTPSVPNDPNSSDALNQSYDDPAATGKVVNSVNTSNTTGPDGQSGSDPLSSMESLRQSLPDSGDAATSAAAGEN